MGIADPRAVLGNLVRGLFASIPRAEPPERDDGAEVIPFEPRVVGGTAAGADERDASDPETMEIARQLSYEPAAIGEARRALEPLGGVVGDETFSDLRLLVSELVTNSVRHSAAPNPGGIDLWVLALDERIHVEVSDGGVRFGPSASGEVDDGRGGWGLHLVELLSDRWGLERDGGTRVWFELDATLDTPLAGGEEPRPGASAAGDMAGPATRAAEGTVRRLPFVGGPRRQRGHHLEPDVD